MHRIGTRAALLTVGLVALACAGDGGDVPERLGVARAELSAAARRARAGQIRDAAFANGITQGWLLAGIADAETGMSQCWSELTWACMGPNSVDCGGGPVVAGAGDGPCDLRQGGLGMFQFDAGTYDDTLAREGDRILTIAGNVAAGVDFVVSMVIRSTFIAGVDTRDQAIAWMNGVRVGNDRWDPWISTVVRYYNGCGTTASCWPGRYASYRDHTSGVYDEMGADFWLVSNVWGAAYVNQTFPLAADPFPLEAGTSWSGTIEMRNTGTETWRPGHTFLGTTEPRDGASPIAASDWVSPGRAASIDREVPPGATGRFNFSVRAPTTPGDYPQFFNLVEEGVTWFGDSGGPADAVLQIRVTSTPATTPPCPDGVGASWSCDGATRVRCEAGMVFREACPGACSAGVCEPTGGTDGDGDGYAPPDDCDDASASVHPGAVEICENGVDDDCAGGDWLCHVDGAASPDGGPRSASRGSASGCAARPGHGRGASALAWLAALAALVALSRRR